MARPLRISFEGAFYHITSRGNEQRAVFFADDDRRRFLKILTHVVQRYQWICHAYCLMDNHYHLIIETPKANLSQGMRHLNGLYTQYINHTHQRVGHLFQGRFKGILVERDRHLLELCRYVILNPVRAGICNDPARYQWSSYRATAGLEANPLFLTIRDVLSNFGQEGGSAIENYAKFVADGVGEPIWDQLAGQIFLGSSEFLVKLPLNRHDIEIPRAQRMPIKPDLGELLKRKNGLTLAHREFGFKIKEIAQVMHVHYATVSRRLREEEKMRDCKT